MKKINEGDICIFDKDNFLGLREEISFITVKVLKKVSNGSLFKYPVYRCQVTGRNEICTISAKYLYPVENESKDNLVVVRYPVNMPMFSQEDIDNVDYLISTIGQSALANREELTKSLLKLKIKLGYYSLLHKGD